MVADVTLELTDQEAHDVQHALSAIVTIIDNTPPLGPRAPLYGARDRLTKVARRLDHERRHHGAIANPNGPSDA